MFVVLVLEKYCVNVVLFNTFYLKALVLESCCFLCVQLFMLQFYAHLPGTKSH